MPTLKEIIGDAERFFDAERIPVLPMYASARLCNETMVEREVSGLVIEENGTPLYLIGPGFLERLIRAIKQKGPPILNSYGLCTASSAFEVAALLPIWLCLAVKQSAPEYYEVANPGTSVLEVSRVFRLPHQDYEHAQFNLPEGEDGVAYRVTQLSEGWYVPNAGMRAAPMSTAPPANLICKKGHENSAWDTGRCSVTEPPPPCCARIDVK